MRAVVYLPPGNEHQISYVQIKEAHGYGLFASEDMPRGRVVAFYWGARRPRSRSAYRMAFDGIELDGRDGGVASLVNHSCGDTINCDFIEEADAVAIQTCTEVARGQELLVSYLPPQGARLVQGGTCRGPWLPCACPRCRAEERLPHVKSRQ